MTVNIDNILSSISSSYKSSGVVNDLDLSKVQLLTLRQVKWIRCIVKSGKLTEKIRNTFLQNLKPVAKNAVAEDNQSEEDDSRADKESSDGESGNEESGDGDSGDEESGDEKSGHEKSSDHVYRGSGGDDG